MEGKKYKLIFNKAREYVEWKKANPDLPHRAFMELKSEIIYVSY